MKNKISDMIKWLFTDGNYYYVLSAILIAAMMFILSSCHTNKKIPTQVIRDTIIINSNNVYIERIDTMYVTIEKESFVNVTLDTISTIGTSYATSTAIVNDGILHHSIFNTDRTIPVMYKDKIVYMDSIVYRNSERVDVVTVPRELTKFQRVQIGVFWAVLATLLAVVVYYIVKLVLRLKKGL